jgi:acyl carrier protein
MAMELEDFVAKFAEQFDETDISEFKAGTEFKGLYEWSSMTALSLIAMIDDEYGVTVKGIDIKNAETIEDLFNTVKGRKA